MSSTITLPYGGTTVSVTVMQMPSAPGFRTVEWDAEDAGEEIVSPWTKQTQVLQYPGADMLTGTMTLPNLTAAQGRAWVAFLQSLRGKSNGFMLGDGSYSGVAGNPQGSVPLVDSASVPASNATGATLLHTRGWKPSSFRLLLPGDYLQVGYRLHRVLALVESDAAGKATLSLWPSLREPAADAAPLILAHPAGIFRRADNKITWSTTIGPITSLSFRVQEYR